MVSIVQDSLSKDLKVDEKKIENGEVVSPEVRSGPAKNEKHAVKFRTYTSNPILLKYTSFFTYWHYSQITMFNVNRNIS